jgi:hypothetical protein
MKLIETHEELGAFAGFRSRHGRSRGLKAGSGSLSERNIRQVYAGRYYLCPDDA